MRSISKIQKNATVHVQYDPKKRRYKLSYADI
jgi:hypothetical protein